MAICQILGQVLMSVQAVEIRRWSWFRNMLQILASIMVRARFRRLVSLGQLKEKSYPCPPPLGPGPWRRPSWIAVDCHVACVSCPCCCFQWCHLAPLLLGMASDPLSPFSTQVLLSSSPKCVLLGPRHVGMGLSGDVSPHPLLGCRDMEAG